MQCRCGSTKEIELESEINFHLSGRLSLSEPGIFVFPNVTACLACGTARFTLREDELNVIVQRLKTL